MKKFFSVTSTYLIEFKYSNENVIRFIKFTLLLN